MTNYDIPVFLLGMMVQLCIDNMLEGMGFLLQSSVHISSIGIHHSSIYKILKKKCYSVSMKNIDIAFNTSHLSQTSYKSVIYLFIIIIIHTIEFQLITFVL